MVEPLCVVKEAGVSYDKIIPRTAKPKAWTMRSASGRPCTTVPSRATWRPKLHRLLRLLSRRSSRVQWLELVPQAATVAVVPTINCGLGEGTKFDVISFMLTLHLLKSHQITLAV